MQGFLAGRTFGFALSIAIVAGIAFLYRHVLLVNQTTVALTLLLAILAVSAVWGMVVSVFMSLAAMLVFNYEFLPPLGTLTFSVHNNCRALAAFLFTSSLSSHLTWRIRCASV